MGEPGLHEGCSHQEGSGDRGGQAGASASAWAGDGLAQSRALALEKDRRGRVPHVFR